MPEVARFGDTISHGGTIITASEDVITNGLGTARVGDLVCCVIHGVNPIVSGAVDYITDEPLTARIGDSTACGAIIISGSPDRIVGDDTGTPPPPPSALFTRPADKPMIMHSATEARNRANWQSYVRNPGAAYNQQAAQDGVKGNYPGTPDTTDQIDPEPAKQSVPGKCGVVIPFLTQCLAEAGRGVWQETGQGGGRSNQNIINIWRSLGYPSSGMWSSDQTAWCAGFVNFALKMSGLPYLKEAGAKNVISRASSIGMVSVPIASMQPGDVVLWNYSHVNFCYTANNGKFSFVGGNQNNHKKGNNPSDGDITNNWTSGWTTSNGGIVAVVRPKC